MKKLSLSILFLFSLIYSFAQVTVVDPRTFTSDTTIQDTDETYGRPTGTNKKYLMKYIRKYVREGFSGHISVNAVSGAVTVQNDVIAWAMLTSATKDSIIAGKKRVSLRASKPSTTYLADIVVDTVGTDSIYIWNFSKYNLFTVGSGSGGVTSSVLADTAAAIRADFPSGSGITALTGDVTASGTGSVAATIANNAVTSAKVASQTLDSTDLKNRGTTLLKLAQSGATNGQVPKYNSTTGNWEPGTDSGGSGSNDTTYINNLTKYIRGESNLKNWRRVINNVVKSGAGNAKVLLIGDSNTEAPSRLYTPLKSFLANSATNNSIGWVGFSDQVAVSDLSITKGGTWATSTYEEGLSLASEVSSTAASTLTIATSSTTYNVCRIHYRVQSGGGTFSWNMDGAGATSVSTSGTEGTGVVTITGLSKATHSLVLTVVSGTVELYGMVAEVNEVGVQVYKAGRSASTTANWAANTVTTNWKQGLKNIAPDLVIVTLGSNDVFFGNSVASYNTNMKAVVGSIRETLGDTCDVMLIACGDYGGISTDDNGEFRDVVRKIAYDSSLVFLSYFDIHKNATRNLADGVYSDNVHWTTLGGSINAGYIGNTLMRTISSAAVDTRWTTTNTTDIRYNTGSIIASGTGGGTIPTGYSYTMNRVVASTPQQIFYVNGGGTNTKVWDNYAGTSALYFRAIDDANSGASIWMQVDRTGTTIDALTFSATKYVFGNNDFGIGATSPSGLEVRKILSAAARGAANVRLGLNSTIPSIFLEASSSDQWNIDNYAGNFRFVRNAASVLGNITSGGLWRLGNGTTSTAWLSVPAGTTTVPPFQLTSGTNNTTPLSGAFEYDGTDFYGTDASLRKKFVRGYRGTGTPESAVTANVGSLFERTDGAGSTILYGKITGTGNTGWAAFYNVGSVLTLPAGTATASTAPLKFTSGTNLTTPEAGAVEYDGTEFYGTTSTASRTIFARVLKGSATLDFGSTAAGAVTDLTITVTGAADGDVVSLSVPNASQTTTGSFSAWVSAANTVTVRYRIAALVGSEDPASGTFKVTVTK